MMKPKHNLTCWKLWTAFTTLHIPIVLTDLDPQVSRSALVPQNAMVPLSARELSKTAFWITDYDEIPMYWIYLTCHPFYLSGQLESRCWENPSGLSHYIPMPTTNGQSSTKATVTKNVEFEHIWKLLQSLFKTPKIASQNAKDWSQSPTLALPEAWSIGIELPQ